MSTTLNEAELIIEDPSLAEDKLLDALENDDFAIPAHIREQRLEEMRRNRAEFSQLKDRHHGQYCDIEEEKVFLEMTTEEKKCVVHFYHPDFKRCEIMDRHLEKISANHFSTKFAKINVSVAKFFVVKLKIQVLPCVLCFRKGQIVDRISGFEEIGNKDNFRTEVLERRLAKSGMIEQSKPGRSNDICNSKQQSAFKRSTKYNNDDDESDD